MKLSEINQKMQENKWFIAAILFFIIWKFFLIGILWEDRHIPPEPDDSYNYLTQIASIAECTSKSCSSTNITLQNSSGFNYLTYRIFFGILGKILHVSIQEIYHFSFYFGIILLTLIFVPFLKSFSQNKDLISWSIFFLSFYHGFGETHGFFWIVPSFFFVIFFFLLTLFLLRDDIQFRYWSLFILTFFYTFLHPMSVFSILILPFYLLFYSFFTWTFPLAAWKKASLIVILVFSFSLTAHHILPNNAPTQKVYSLTHVAQEARSNLELDSSILSPTTGSFSLLHPIVLEKIQTLNHTYFRWLLPHWFFIFPLVITLLVLVFKKNIKLLSLYFASLTFFIIATLLNQFGYRSAIILWPLTYLIFAFSSWHLLQTFYQSKNWYFKKIFFWFFIASIGCFFFINSIFAIIFNEYFSTRNNYHIESSLIKYILTEIPEDKIIMASRELIIAEMFNSPDLRKRVVSYHPEADFIIITITDKIPQKKPNKIFHLIQSITKKSGKELSLPYSSTTPYTAPSGYVYDREFGMFTIYKKLP